MAASLSVTPNTQIFAAASIYDVASAARQFSKRIHVSVLKQSSTWTGLASGQQLRKAALQRTAAHSITVEASWSADRQQNAQSRDQVIPNATGGARGRGGRGRGASRSPSRGPSSRGEASVAPEYFQAAQALRSVLEDVEKEYAGPNGAATLLAEPEEDYSPSVPTPRVVPRGRMAEVRGRGRGKSQSRSRSPVRSSAPSTPRYTPEPEQEVAPSYTNGAATHYSDPTPARVPRTAASVPVRGRGRGKKASRSPVRSRSPTPAPTFSYEEPSYSSNGAAASYSSDSSSSGDVARRDRLMAARRGRGARGSKSPTRSRVSASPSRSRSVETFTYEEPASSISTPSGGDVAGRRERLLAQRARGKRGSRSPSRTRASAAAPALRSRSLSVDRSPSTTSTELSRRDRLMASRSKSRGRKGSRSPSRNSRASAISLRSTSSEPEPESSYSAPSSSGDASSRRERLLAARSRGRKSKSPTRNSRSPALRSSSVSAPVEEVDYSYSAPEPTPADVAGRRERLIAARSRGARGGSRSRSPVRSSRTATPSYTAPPAYEAPEPTYTPVAPEPTYTPEPARVPRAKTAEVRGRGRGKRSQSRSRSPAPGRRIVESAPQTDYYSGSDYSSSEEDEPVTYAAPSYDSTPSRVPRERPLEVRNRGRGRSRSRSPVPGRRIGEVFRSTTQSSGVSGDNGKGNSAVAEKSSEAFLDLPSQGSSNGSLSLSRRSDRAPARKSIGQLRGVRALVAGAGDRIGRVIAEKLAAEGVSVRAIVDKNDKEMGDLTEISGVDVVKLDLHKYKDVQDALGDCDVILCTIGIRYDPMDPLGLFTVAGGQEHESVKNLIAAAKNKGGVKKFVFVTSVGASLLLAPLNLFWGPLFWKKQSEMELQESGLDYTIIRPGGLTGLDSKSATLVMKQADTLFGGTISRAKVADICLAAVVLPEASNKIVEVIMEEGGPVLSIEELFSQV
eukprot:TRINITY_DN159_c0_g1_i1.p1 TRINITY_DN159_c0_g1~~TRINITY_DN159_c0_g1_i1.p1  ORF type:complete len:960 (-),score=132.72 TRINITY_DN159_c0_g1_i1:1897-4776(-)